jgi:hypothetical protein
MLPPTGTDQPAPAVICDSNAGVIPLQASMSPAAEGLATMGPATTGPTHGTKPQGKRLAISSAGLF